jgi:hypothetical protein
MPCRTDMCHCNNCGGEHYYPEECVIDPSKYGEGLSGYNPQTAAALSLAKSKKSEVKEHYNTEGALCDILTLLENQGLLCKVGIPQDIMEWWSGHQSKEQEKIKSEAMAKLSDKEKRALGLK